VRQIGKQVDVAKAYKHLSTCIILVNRNKMQQNKIKKAEMGQGFISASQLRWEFRPLFPTFILLDRTM
jgi:hypothetical protein